MDGWIKLYRKSKENPLMLDFTAWGTFTYILLSVNKDTGVMFCGRNNLSSILGLKPTTLRDAIYRLRDRYKVIATSNAKTKTEIRVLNWHKYQHNPTPNATPDVVANAKLTPTQRHYTRIENKEIRTSLHDGEPAIVWNPYEDKYKIYSWYRKDKAGYILLSKNNPPHIGKGDIVQEHHWVYMKERGLDDIPTGFHINHVNGQKDDNRIENLELLKASEHLRKYRMQEINQGLDPYTKKPVAYGNQDINLLIAYMKERLGLPALDESERVNRMYAQNCLRKFGSVEKIKLLIDSTATNDFWSTRITSFKGLYYKAVQIISSSRDVKGGVTKL